MNSTKRSRLLCKMLVRSLLGGSICLVGVVPVYAGGWSGKPGVISFSSIGETKTTTPSVELDPSIPKRVIRALKAAPKYIEDAKGNGDAAHQKAAYEWGYEVGDPTVVAALRTAVEVGQFFAFTPIDGLIMIVTAGQKRFKYTPTTITGDGGLLDSKNDIRNAKQGAIDKANGLPPNPPS